MMKTYTILYKSGAKVHIRAKDCEWSFMTETNELTRLVFTSVAKHRKPLHFGIMEIAAVFRGKV